jgi:hypothetical protein
MSHLVEMVKSTMQLEALTLGFEVWEGGAARLESLLASLPSITRMVGDCVYCDQETILPRNFGPKGFAGLRHLAMPLKFSSPADARPSSALF